jgi:hypothetical protein
MQAEKKIRMVALLWLVSLTTQAAIAYFVIPLLSERVWLRVLEIGVLLTAVKWPGTLIATLLELLITDISNSFKEVK